MVKKKLPSVMGISHDVIEEYVRLTRGTEDYTPSERDKLVRAAAEAFKALVDHDLGVTR